MHKQHSWNKSATSAGSRVPLRMPGTRELGPLMTTSTTTRQSSLQSSTLKDCKAGQIGTLLKGHTQGIVSMTWRHKDTKNGKARVSKNPRPWLVLMELQFPLEIRGTQADLSIKSEAPVRTIPGLPTKYHHPCPPSRISPLRWSDTCKLKSVDCQAINFTRVKGWGQAVGAGRQGWLPKWC